MVVANRIKKKKIVSIVQHSEMPLVKGKWKLTFKHIIHSKVSKLHPDENPKTTNLNISITLSLYLSLDSACWESCHVSVSKD